MADDENKEVTDAETPEEQETKTSRRTSKPKKAMIQVFDNVAISRIARPGGSGPLASFSTPISPEAGQTIEIKTNSGIAYQGTIDEIIEDDEKCHVTFTNEGLKPA